jgi:hypothetical protein
MDQKNRYTNLRAKRSAGKTQTGGKREYISKKEQLSQSMEEIFFNRELNDFTFSPGDLPSSLKKINLNCYNKPVKAGVFPEGLLALYLGSDFDQPLRDSDGDLILPSTPKILSTSYQPRSDQNRRRDQA